MAIDSTVMHSFHFSVGFLKSLLEGIDDGQRVHQPKPGMNHPAWVVGHLVFAMEFTAKLVGAAYTAPEGWSDLFGMKSTPSDDPSQYPDMAALLAELDKSIAAVTPSLESIGPEALAAQMPDEGFRKMMPTVGDGLTFLINGHIAMHVGQLSAWRRACGMPPLF
jgi:DinB superfamily